MTQSTATEQGATPTDGTPTGPDGRSGSDDPTQDVASLGYEAARDELVDVVRRLEAGGEPLEASLALWERGEALAARCQQWLDGARARLDASTAHDPAQDTDENEVPGTEGTGGR